MAILYITMLVINLALQERYETHVVTTLVGMTGFEPAASRFRTGSKDKKYPLPPEISKDFWF